MHSFTTSTTYSRTTYMLQEVTRERDGLNAAEQGAKTKQICCRSFMSTPGPQQAGSQRVRKDGLLCVPDHSQELWHSETIREVISS